MKQLAVISSVIFSLAAAACSDSEPPAADPDRGVAAPDQMAPDTAPPARYPFDITGMKWANVPGGAATPPATLFYNKVVFVSCFQAWCPGCRTYGIPMTKLLLDKYRGNPNIVIMFLQTVFEGHSTNTFDRGLRELTVTHGIQNPLYAFEASAGNMQSTPFMKTYKTGGTPSFVIFRKDASVAYQGIPRNSPKLHEWVNLIDPLLTK
jgi:thiol-disulfide isomerase/thioredoxin